MQGAVWAAVLDLHYGAVLLRGSRGAIGTWDFLVFGNCNWEKIGFGSNMTLMSHMTGGRGRLQYYLKGSTRFGIIKVNHVLDSGVEMVK